MPFVAPKMAVSQFKSEEEFCRDSENGRKTLPRFESGRGDLHAHRVSRKNLDYVCCRSSFALPRGTTCFPKQQVVARNRKENLATRQKAASISRNLPVGEQAYRQLTELYRALRLYVNCFQPSMKLLSKQRDGKKVRCVYDPAKTPLQRLLQSGVLPAEMQQELTEVAQALDPICLFQQLEQLQRAVFRCAVGCSPFVSSPLSNPLHVFSVEKCTAGKHPEERSVPDPRAGLETLYREQGR